MIMQKGGVWEVIYGEFLAMVFSGDVELQIIGIVSF